MSLLLQALQRASRHREDVSARSEPGSTSRERALGEPSRIGPTLSERAEPDGEPPLSLADADALFAPEPMAPAEIALAPVPGPPESSRHATRQPEPPGMRSAGASDGPAQAASLLRVSEPRSTGALDWVRDRPVHATLVLAAIFAFFYGIYLYVAINHPGVLRGEFPWSSPPRKAAVKRPVSPPQQPAARPADVSNTAPAMPSNVNPAVQATPTESGAAPPVTASRAGTGPQPADKRLAGLPQPPAPAVQDRPQPEQAQPQQEPIDDTPSRAPRRTPRAQRQPTVEVEATTLEDSVAVRPPPAATVAPPRTLMQAWEALQEGRYEEARKLYQEALQADAQSVDALLGLAALAARAGNAEEAGRSYARALEIEPRNSAAQAGLISIIGQADPLQSESRLKQLITREPSGFLYFALGNLYARQGLWAQAQPAFFQAYELQPDNPDYAYNLAVGLEHLSQPKIALNYYRRALELGLLKGHAGFDQARVEERIGQLTARVGSGQ